MEKRRRDELTFRSARILSAWMGLLLSSCCAYAEDVTDPRNHVINRRYETGDVIKQMSFDINGDGVLDSFFTTIEGNPDSTTTTSNEQSGGSLSWDVYVSHGANTFKVNTNVEIDGEITQGAGLSLNQDEMYVGNTAEIGRFAVVTSAVERSKSENSTIIYAYTWEGDHFKRWKLAGYLAGQQNAVFDKYLKDDKRTHVTVKQIKP